MVLREMPTTLPTIVFRNREIPITLPTTVFRNREIPTTLPTTVFRDGCLNTIHVESSSVSYWKCEVTY